MEIDAKLHDCYIALSAAANHGYLPIIELLLKHGANIMPETKKEILCF
jgi:Ankyrin repeat.